MQYNVVVTRTTPGKVETTTIAVRGDNSEAAAREAIEYVKDDSTDQVWSPVCGSTSEPSYTTDVKPA